jgi:chromosome segregation ATPase
MGAFEDAKSEIESLRDEMTEWKDNLEGNSMEHLPKYDEVSECCDALDNAMSALEDAESEEWPEALDSITVNWTIDTRKSATSRSARMSNALNALGAAIDGLRQWEESEKEEDKESEEHEEQIQTAGNIADHLENAQSEAENANFPGMF